MFDEDGLSEELDARVRSELLDGEKLLWTGQPRPDHMARQTWPIVLIGIIFTAFSVLWIAGVSGVLFGDAGGPMGHGMGVIGLIFPLFGLPFLLIGVLMFGSPFWVRRRARQTCYALTNRRAILWEAGWFGSVEIRTYGPTDLSKIRRVEYSSGAGDLIFDEITTIGSDSQGHRTTSVTRRGFMGINGVREAEVLLRKTLLADR